MTLNPTSPTVVNAVLPVHPVRFAPTEHANSLAKAAFPNAMANVSISKQITLTVVPVPKSVLPVRFALAVHAKSVVNRDSLIVQERVSICKMTDSIAVHAVIRAQRAKSALVANVYSLASLD